MMDGSLQVDVYILRIEFTVTETQQERGDGTRQYRKNIPQSKVIVGQWTRRHNVSGNPTSPRPLWNRQETSRWSSVNV